MRTGFPGYDRIDKSLSNIGGGVDTKPSWQKWVKKSCDWQHDALRDPELLPITANHARTYNRDGFKSDTLYVPFNLTFGTAIEQGYGNVSRSTAGMGTTFSVIAVAQRWPSVGRSW